MSSQDLHDRALLYYRLLRNATDPQIVKSIVATTSDISGASNFSEENFDHHLRDELMKEFNTLSIVYGTTSENFIAEENQVRFVKMPADHPLDAGAAAVPVDDVSVNNLVHQVQETSLHGATASAPEPYVPSLATPTPMPEVDLLGFGPEPTPAPVSAPSSFALKANVTISGEEYQSKWGAVPDSEAHVVIVPLATPPPSTDSIETPLGQSSIKTMASGELPTELKFFLYAQEATQDGSVVLVQASIAKGFSPTEMLLTIKISGPGGLEKADAFVEILKSSLSAFVI
jgi:AP-4 complex subunit beta-1